MTVHAFCSLILAHLGSLRARLVCFLFPPTFSASTSWHIPGYLFASVPFLTQYLVPEGSWTPFIHLTLPFFLREAFHVPHSILCSFLKSKVLNIIYKVLQDLALSPLTPLCDSLSHHQSWYIDLLSITWKKNQANFLPLQVLCICCSLCLNFLTLYSYRGWPRKASLMKRDFFFF